MKSHQSINITLASFNIKIIFHYDLAESQNKTLYEDIIHFYRPFLSTSAKKTDLLINIHKSCTNVYKCIIKKYKKTTFTFIKLSESSNNQISLEDNLSFIQLNFILTTNLYKLILSSGGIIFHASAGIADGKVFIFTGESGAGKSTIIKLLNGFIKPIADDQVILIKKNNKFICYQSCFADRFKEIPLSSKGFEVEAIYFITKFKSNKAQLIKNSKFIIHRLAEQVTTDAKSTIKQYNSLLSISKSTKFYQLHFLKNREQFLGFFKNYDW